MSEPRPVEQPLIILADTYRQAKHYARGHYLAPSRWRYARDPHDIRGRHGGKYVDLTTPGYYDSWVETQKRDELLLILQMNGFAPWDAP